jgi:transketolase
VDGHDIGAFIDAIQECRRVRGQPSIVIAHTVKGKGVSFMENVFSWHARVPTATELELALAELGLAAGEEA